MGAALMVQLISFHLYGVFPSLAIIANPENVTSRWKVCWVRAITFARTRQITSLVNRFRIYSIDIYFRSVFSLTFFVLDVTFILAISMLSMLKIYQTRHPDINAEAWAAFSVLAFSVLLGVISIFQDGLLFRASFLTIHLGFSLALSAQVYYMGRWNLGKITMTLLHYIHYNTFTTLLWHQLFLD